MKIFTLEFDTESKMLELHLDKTGAQYLRDLLNHLLAKGVQEHQHLMTSDLGGEELTLDKQNQSSHSILLHHLKIMYWNDSL